LIGWLVGWLGAFSALSRYLRLFFQFSNTHGPRVACLKLYQTPGGKKRQHKGTAALPLRTGPDRTVAIKIVGA
jgi:hypothetical protein